MTPEQKLDEKRRDERESRQIKLSLRRVFEPLTLVLIAAGVPLTVYAMFASAADTRGDTGWGYFAVLSPAIPTALSVLVLAGSRRSGLHFEGLQRSIFVGGASGLLYGAVIAVVYELPAFRDAVVHLADGSHDMWPEGGGNPFLAPATLGFGVALLAGAAVVVWVLLPVLAIVRPESIGPSGWGTREEDGRYSREIKRYLRLWVATIDVVLLTAVLFGLGWHPWTWIGVAASIVIVVLLRRQAAIAFAKW